MGDASGWSVDADVLVCGPLRLALQRIGASHWQAQGVLRSWGPALLHRHGQRVGTPCADDEALWIGAWLEPRGGSAAVTLIDRDSGLAVRIALPSQSRITALADAQPLARRRGQAERAFDLALEYTGGASVRIELRLLEPEAWTAASGRAVPPLDGPPPLPPRLG